MTNRGFWVASAIAIVLVVACKKSNEPAAAGSAGTDSASTSAAAGRGSAVAAASVVDAGVLIDAASADAPFRVGEVVWSLWDDGKARRGKLLAINADGTFQIQWDGKDGMNDRWPAEFAKRDKPLEEPFKVGERVWSLWDDGRPHRGKILKFNANGTVRMSWDETDDSDWPLDLLRRTKPAPVPKAASASSGGGGAASSGGKACNEGSEYTRCGGSCFNLRNSDSNCGACGNKCPKTARTCSNGKCVCMSGQFDSDGDCL